MISQSFEVPNILSPASLRVMGRVSKAKRRLTLVKAGKGAGFFGGYEALLHHRVILKSL